MAQHTSIKVYSRTILDDAGTYSRYEYNGSYGFFGNIEEASNEQKEEIAKAMDCFFDVLFIVEGAFAVPYTMADYR